jgi:pimeloyl-ACP methyl ester carboxylesterase
VTAARFPGRLRRLPAPALVVAAALLLSAAPARAAVAFRPCGSGGLARCGTVAVPLDRAGAVPGTVRLYVKRVGPVRPRGAVFALAGGPGQAATPFAEDTAVLFRGVLRGRAVYAFDQRGTGRSGALRCPTLTGLGERIQNFAGAAADCALLLGRRREFFTTRDSVEDMEAVRQAIGVDKVTIYGVSYGTKVALAYAALHPDHVERLVLDSVVATNGPDPFGRDSVAAFARMLRQLCGRRACKRFTSDPAQDLAALVARFKSGTLKGFRVRDNGRARSARMNVLRLLDLLFAGDFDPTLRAGLPAAMRSALNGDAAPLLRLSHRAESTVSEPLSDFSNALYAATRCGEGPLPWSAATPLADRPPATAAALAATSPAALWPLDAPTLLSANESLLLCRLWPSPPRSADLTTGPFPAVPALVLSGAADLRTPAETASAVSRLLPRATHVVVPDVGHSVLDWPNAVCAQRALRRFFANRPVRPCKGRNRIVPLEQIAPTSLLQLPTPIGYRPRVGRTLVAIQRTLEDIGVQLVGTVFAFDIFRSAIGGLRGGRARFADFGIALDRVQYVPGVALDGELRGRNLSRGFVRVSGRGVARGRLRLRHGVLSGRLAGERVRLRLPAEVLGGEERRSRRRKRGASRPALPAPLGSAPLRLGARRG